MSRWHLLVTRRIGIQVAQAWNHAFWRMKKPYGIGVDRIRIESDGKKADYFVDADQWDRFQTGIRRKLGQNAFVRRFAADAKGFLERQSRIIRRSCRSDFSAEPDANLRKRFERIGALVDGYYTRMWMVFLINEPLAEAVLATLEERVPDAAGELLQEFSSPLVPNDAIRERLQLLRIASEKDPSCRERLLQGHARRFSHIPMFDFGNNPYDLAHFRRELSRIKDPLAELTHLQHGFHRRKRGFPKRLSMLNLPENGLETAQIRMLSDLAHLRDYRDTLRQKMNLALRKLYAEIARRAKMTLAEVSLLTDDEIRTVISEPKTRPGLRAIARERQSGFLFEETPRGHSIRVVAPKKPVCASGRNAPMGTIRGIGASPGMASGPARIVLSNQDLHKIRPGDVMVAAMTRQDFVPAMRRCAAVVTDEGGVTCHAAIICRELSIPCVVGTKTATRILKDGWKIRLDGRKGTAHADDGPTRTRKKTTPISRASKFPDA